jgi:hypothetical protein
MRRPLSWLGGLVILLVLSGGAYAQKVDWSQYLEDKPSRAAPQTPAKGAARTATKAKPAKKAVAKKAVAKKGNTKARAKAKPRRK